MNIFPKLKIKKIAAAFILATFVFATTGCNSGDDLGARPNVAPVQLGGQNNPHKAGGDGMTQYRSPVNDPMLEKGQSSLNLPSDKYLAIAKSSETTYPNNDERVEGLLYSDSNKVDLDRSNEFVSPQRQSELFDPAQIPAKKQPAIERSNPNNQLLEKVGQMFNDAADFSAN